MFVKLVFNRSTFLSISAALLVVLSGCNDNTGTKISKVNSPASAISQVQPSEDLSKPIEIPSDQNKASSRSVQLFQEVDSKLVSTRGEEAIVPDFNISPEALTEYVENEIATATEQTNSLIKNDPAEMGADAFLMYDDIHHDFLNTENVVYLLMSASPNSAVRDAASDAFLKMENWNVESGSRKDVYEFLNQAEQASRLEDQGFEVKKYMADVLGAFKRNGMSLSDEDLAEVNQLRQQLSEVSNNFSNAIRDAKVVVSFEPAELEGVNKDFIATRTVKSLGPVETEEVKVLANITGDYLEVMENAAMESTRMKLATARYSIAKEENLANLQKMVDLRHEIAKKLGYESWGDFRTADRMAGSRQAALDLLLQLKDGFEPKFERELAELKELKEKQLGSEDLMMAAASGLVLDTDIHIWDFRYFLNQLKKEKYSVDTSALRRFFPLEKVKQGVFDVYGDLFQIDISQQQAPSIWAPGIEFYQVKDRQTQDTLGFFYLDLFPRDGKFQHFAFFSIVEAKRLANGMYRRPVGTLECNFPKPEKEGEPSFLSHDDVETFFHEFGHLMHAMVTKAQISALAGTNVEQDFVEAPSQMFEAWAWNKGVLDRFAENYDNPGEKISQDLLDRMKAAKVGTQGMWYRRQLSFGIMDMRLHGPEDHVDVQKVNDETLAEVFMPEPEGSFFAANFGHLDGYDAGYYSYAWADVISQDMLSVFEDAPNGMLDIPTGLRLRNEVYSMGGTRPAKESIKKFLGRDYNIDAFLKNNGVEN